VHGEPRLLRSRGFLMAAVANVKRLRMRTMSEGVNLAREIAARIKPPFASSDDAFAKAQATLHERDWVCFVTNPFRCMHEM
jgi:hypothetical protein